MRTETSASEAELPGDPDVPVMDPLSSPAFLLSASVRPAPRRNRQETTTEVVRVDSEGQRDLSI